MEKGKLIVIEGACDGIGKTTQFNKLKEKLEKDGNIVISHHFPTYDSYQGLGAVNYLKGEFGKPEELSAYFINNLYASDRAITWYSKLKKEYEKGNIILLDRYTTSTLIYQSALIEDESEKKAFVDYVIDYEFNKIQIKEPDEVIFLYAPFDVVTKLRNERKQNDGVQNDIHESDIEFMRKAYNSAVWVANYLNWNYINCTQDDKMRSEDEIHEDICKLILKK